MRNLQKGFGSRILEGLERLRVRGEDIRRELAPFTEDETVEQVLDEFPTGWNGCKFERLIRYPSSPRNKCDLCIANPFRKLFIEVKMMRLFGDNEKPNDNIAMHILSPYPQHRSALTDIQKLKESGFEGDKAIVIYGYDYDDYPMSLMMDCFEILAGDQLCMPARSREFDGLIHPVHRRGKIYGWMLR